VLIVKKKAFAIVISFVMVLALFAGCSSKDSGGGSGSTDDGKTKLVYWNLFGGGDGEFMNEMVKQFNESQDEIVVEGVTLEWGEYYTKFMTAVAAGKGPDIGVSHVSKLPEMVSQGLVYDLDNFADAAGVDWSSYNQNILDATIFEGKHYAIPIDTHPQVMYYNKTILKDAGLLDDQGNPTIEPGADGFTKFLTTLKANTSDDIIPFSFSTAGNDPFWLWWGLYHQLGGNDVVSDDLKSASIDMDKAVKAATYIKDFYHTHNVVPLNLEDFYQTFQSGDAGIFVTGVWATGIMEKTEELDFGVMPIPQLFDKQATWGDSHTLVVPIQQKEDESKLEAATKFMNWIADNGQLWAQAGHIPSKTTVAESQEFKDLPYRSDYVEVASTVAFPKQSDKVWPIRDVLVRELDTVWSGDTSPEDAFTKIEKEINNILSK
jgi:multiple sugar transport system substrate-binding protein